MKLGLSQASYRWVCYPHLRYDTPEYRLSERRLPYFTSVDPPADLYNPVPWLLQRVAAHDLRSLYMVAGWLRDDDGARAFGAERKAHELEFLAAASVLKIAVGSSLPRVSIDRETRIRKL